MSEVEIRLTLNGEERTASVEPRLLLSDFIRHGQSLTGAVHTTILRGTVTARGGEPTAC